MTKLPDTAGKRKFPQLKGGGEVFAQEINVLGLEGRMFDFRRKHAGDEHSVTFTNHRDHTVTLSFNPLHGRPGVTAYKVMQAIFRKITVEGHPVEGKLAFSQSDLLDLAGRGRSGEDMRQLESAIRQLTNTEIECEFYDKETSTTHHLIFRIITKVYFAEQRGRITACALWIDDDIVKSMNHHYWALFNWHRIADTDVVTIALAKRLFWHFSTLSGTAIEKLHQRSGTLPHLVQVAPVIKDVTLEKKLAPLFEEWLGGLKLPKHVAHIRAEYGPRFDKLKERGLIRSWTIAKSEDGTPKITFKPGDGFIIDYLGMYHSKLQPRLKFTTTAQQATIAEPLELVSLFYRELTGNALLDTDMFSDKDRQFASELLEKHGRADVEDFIRFAVRAAKTDNFPVRMFVGLKHYIPAWLAFRELGKTRAVTHTKRIERDRTQDLKDAYSLWQRQEVDRLLASLSDDDRSSLMAQAEQNTPASASPTMAVHRTMVRISLNKLVCDRFDVPSFEDWRQQQPAPRVQP